MNKKYNKTDNRRSRERGLKNQTQLEILLFILNDDKGRPEILNHTNFNLKISKNSNNIDRQLNILEKEKSYIVSIRKENIGHRPKLRFLKVNDKYRDYKGLKTIYRFIINEGERINRKYKLNRDWGLEFLHTNYAQDMINENIFFHISEEIFKSIFISCEKQKVSKEVYTNVDLEEFENEYLKYIKIYDVINVGISGKKMDFSELRSKILFPSDERQTMIEMIQSSPSALSYILSIGDENVTKDILLRGYLFYYVPTLFLLAFNEIYKIEDRKQLEFLKQVIEKRDPKTPLYEILKSYVIIDIISNRIIETKWVIEFKKSLLNVNIIFHKEEIGGVK